MALPRLISLILTYIALPVLAQNCPTNWVQFQSKCYMFTTNTFTFPQCTSFCSASQGGATMLCIENMDQNNFIDSNFNDGVAYSTLIGLGQDSNGQFVWFPGCASSLTNWYPGEPNQNMGPNEYTELIHGDGRWNDTPDYTGAYCACELNVGDLPSSQPSGQPSDQPSIQPSNQPSGQPSNQPSEQPSLQPTEQPSSQPSNQPSDQPSAQPTSQPSTQPSGQPSDQPSSQPTFQPTTRPSAQPSLQPSSQPTEQPSTRPSAQPSHQPSSQPTEQPSSQPSSQPSFQPSDQPSTQPSNQPSGQPSDKPSTQPSGQPTAPTKKPTASPTTVPTTAKPTANPTPQIEFTQMRPKVPPFTELYDRANTPATKRQSIESTGSSKSVNKAQSGDEIKSKINKMREKVAVMRGEL
jgi:hypothetical protein